MHTAPLLRSGRVLARTSSGSRAAVGAAQRALTGKVLDRGRDDYFAHPLLYRGAADSRTSSAPSRAERRQRGQPPSCAAVPEAVSCLREIPARVLRIGADDLGDGLTPSIRARARRGAQRAASPRRQTTEQGLRRARSSAALASIAVIVSLAQPAYADELLSFAPVADTSVRADQPTTSAGAATRLNVDASPQRVTFLRFDVTALAGCAARRVRLRLYQQDASRTGGRVLGLSATSWAESITWNTRPSIDGPVLATFPAVSSGNWYEIELPVAVVASRPIIALALDSTSSDGAQWASRESGATAPQLLVDAGTGVADGLTQVAGSTLGSSDATYYPSNHRVAMTTAGRTLVVYGRHSTGVQLAWRDATAASWSTATLGALSTGLLLGGTGTGDWPASIAVRRDTTGAQSAWVVWAGQNFGVARALQARQLTNLDALGGPTVGPLVTLDAPTLGAARADVGVERAADGSERAVVVWSRRVGETAYELVAAHLDETSSGLREVVALHRSTSAGRAGNVVTVDGGVRIAARISPGLTVYGRDAGAPLGTWWQSAPGVYLPSAAAPSAVALGNGSIVAAADRTDGVVVQRWSTSGWQPAELQLPGYRQPVLTGDAQRMWLVMVRVVDGALVSRSFSATTGWSGDNVEVGPEVASGLAWPNVSASTSDGRLRVVVTASGASSTRRQVLALQRPL